jgi:hypothetical protein
MIVVLSLVLVFVVAALGFWILPFLGMIVVGYPVTVILRPINKWVAYMVSRYGTFVLDCFVLAWIIIWAGNKWGLITWPAWLVAGWAILMEGNTLLFFDLHCYLTDSGAWRKSDPT